MCGRSLQGVQVSASRRSGTTDELGPGEPERDGADLLAALLDGMDAALCAFDAGGVVTHWNREAERILGWSAAEAVGRHGFAGWAVRTADAAEVERRLLSAMESPGRQVHEFALLTKDGGRVLVRTQSAAVRGPEGKPAGVYCAFSEVHAQIDLERSIALSEALFEDASWGVVLVDADLRPAVVNAHAARDFGLGRTAVLGRPLGELLAQGVEELENAITHVLAEGAPPAPAELWVTVRTPEGEKRRCWVPQDLAYKGQAGKPAGTVVFDIELVDTRPSPTIPPPDVAEVPKDASRTGSGLAYKVLRKGTGFRHPDGLREVVVHYTGWTTDGKMFDSSVPRGAATPMRLDEVITGWKEGVQLMVEGERTRFWIPQDLAYKGQAGSPRGMLVFDIELVKIN